MDRMALLLEPPVALGVTDSVGALLTDPDGRYLMQERDVKPGIFFPGCLSLFGGGIEPDETPVEAMHRELFEELGLRLVSARLEAFGSMVFDWAGASGTRWFYQAGLDEDELNRIRLGEGAALRRMSPRELFASDTLSPVDAQAVWFHHCRRSVFPVSRKEARGR